MDICIVVLFLLIIFAIYYFYISTKKNPSDNFFSRCASCNSGEKILIRKEANTASALNKFIEVQA